MRKRVCELDKTTTTTERSKDEISQEISLMMVECYKSRVGNTEREMLRLQDDNGVPRCPKDAKEMTAPCIAVVNKAKKDSE